MLLQADTYNNAIRLVGVASGTVSTLAGSPSQSTGFADGAGTLALFTYPRNVAIDATGDFALVVSESVAGNSVGASLAAKTKIRHVYRTARAALARDVSGFLYRKQRFLMRWNP